MSDPIAIVATACEFPEARDPLALWQMALHGRRCFRRIPAQRLDLSDYAVERGEPDSIYPIEAGLIEGYQFDRHRFKVPRSTFEGTDLAHWLALDVTDRALATLPGAWQDRQDVKDRIAVIVANTLTGEFSRANLTRYRWPYVRRQLQAALAACQTKGDSQGLMADFERRFKQPFPVPDEDSLAGGLSNTIAGRISNHFGLRGGAYSTDGACASSLVAVASACDRLASADVDCAVVCAVDLSLDPFELVGFARNGAMARQEMRVFDRACQGFWPGEGGACVILARAELADAMRWPVLGWIRGVGMSTDGHGGLTRPTRDGQLLAQRRAWAQAGLDPAGVAYIEAHGTGTPTGDPVELLALADLIGTRSTRRRRGAVPVGSIKANIGHTKAAAGLAGLLKALSVVRLGVVPPTSGCIEPHPVLDEPAVRRAVRVVRRAETVGGTAALSAGINGFGFGGVNCHVVLLGPHRARVRMAPGAARLPRCVEGVLAGELLQIVADSRQGLIDKLVQMSRRARVLARSELVDLAASLVPASASNGDWRACAVADSPQQLQARCDALVVSLRDPRQAQRVVTPDGSWSAPMLQAPAIGYLFPGQGLPVGSVASTWVARFPALGRHARLLVHAPCGDETSDLQPVLAVTAMATLDLMAAFGLRPCVTIGHSFGELSAWYAAGVFDGQAFTRLARARGRAMQEECPASAMLALACDLPSARALADQHDLDLACLNGPLRHVLAGTVDAVESAVQACARQGIDHVRLPTRRAFHSRMMQSARHRFARDLAQTPLCAPAIPVASTITGQRLGVDALAELLEQQFTEPVRFEQAVGVLGHVDLLLELGAGSQLGQLVGEMGGPHALSIGFGGPSLQPLLAALGAVWTLGVAVDTRPLYEGRLVRSFDLSAEPRFLHNPCGAPETRYVSAPPASAPADAAPAVVPVGRRLQEAILLATDAGRPALDVLRDVVCMLTELDSAHVAPDARLLADLHLNSIRARHAVATAARRLGITRLPFNPGELVNARLSEIARHLDALQGVQAQGAASREGRIAGIAGWVRLLTYDWRDQPPDPPMAPDCEAPAMRLDDELAPAGANWRVRWAPKLTDDSVAPVLLLLPADADERVADRLLRRVGELIADQGPPGLLVLQRAQLANAFLRSAALELPGRRIVVVQCDPELPQHTRLACQLYARRAQGYSEMRLLGERVQQRMALALGPMAKGGNALPGRADLVLVSGGAKGIGAVSAAWMARRFGCRLLLIGRSAAEEPEVAAGLASMRASGAQVHYLQLDLADARATMAALQRMQQDLGPVHTVVHAAGINRPCALRDIDGQELRATWAAKVGSLDSLLASMTSPPRLLIGYGSVIGALGLRGEAHYALANEWLVMRLLKYAANVPTARVLPLCWTAWSETGMAKRLPHVLDQLDSDDVDALSNQEALAQLDAVLASDQAGQALLISGRLGLSPDPVRDLPALHRHRFLERPRVFYPGVELIADAHVSVDSDPYLLDHATGGVVVLPLVVAIEAMLSAAICLCQDARGAMLQDLRIGEAIAWNGTESLVLRTLALRHTDGTMELALRCSISDFVVDHFSARLQMQRARSPRRHAVPMVDQWLSAEPLLYQGLAFHGPSFQRVHAYGTLGALECVFQLRAAPLPRWYAAILPGAMAIGHPAVRDALLHGLQACIPQHVVLPVGVDRVVPGDLDPGSVLTVHGRQVAGDATIFVFDIDVIDGAGRRVEQWGGLRLHRLATARRELHAWQALDAYLLEPFVGRLLHDDLQLRGASVGVATAGCAQDARDEAVRRVIGPGGVMSHRPNGAPSVPGRSISITHAGLMALCVSHAHELLACDIESDTNGFASAGARTLMLGPERAALAQALAARDDVAPQLTALVVWSASECLLKLGRQGWPFALAHIAAPQWCRTGPIWTWRSGSVRLASALLRVGAEQSVTAVAVARATAPESPVPTRTSRARKRAGSSSAIGV